MTALENILSQEIVQRLGWTLVHFVWQASAVALLLAALMAILRKASANLRYTVACLALALIVLAPIVTIQLVPVSIPGPPVTPPPAPAPVVPPTVQVSELPPVEAPTIVPPAAVETAISPPAVGRSRMQRLSERLEPALPHVVSAWLIGVLALSLWHLGGWTQLQRLRRRMVRPVDEPLRARLDELAAKLGVTRAVQLTESALVQIPTVVGWLRPVILLPASALTGLTTEQLDAILAHELAHIRRHDYFVNMLQIIVETLGFYHPAVWWISHKIRTERENCCDDLAIVATGDRVRYARALTSMEEIRGRNNELAVTAAGGNLFSRIRRLIGKDSDEKTVSWIPAVAVILLLVGLVISTTLALAANEEHPADESTANKSESKPSSLESNDSGTKILIETQIIHAGNELLEEVGLDSDSLKNSDSWTQYRVDDSGNPSMFVIDSHAKETLLEKVEDSEGSSAISRIFLMATASREAMIENNGGYDFKSQELGRFIKIKPQLSQDGRSVNLDCELLMRQFSDLNLFLDVYVNKKVDQNDVSEAEIVELRTNTANILLGDDKTLLILGGRLVSLQDVENGPPVLRHIPVVSELLSTTSKIKVEKNEIILIKTSIVPPEQSDNVDSKAASYTVAKMTAVTNELLRVFLDLHLEPGQYVEIRDMSQSAPGFVQVATGDIGRTGKDWPAYAWYIDFEIRSNFDLNLATKRYTRASFFAVDRWDATFTGPDTIIGDGQFSPTTLRVSIWKAKLWKQRPGQKVVIASIPSLVAVVIKPSDKPQDPSAEAEKWSIKGRESTPESAKSRRQEQEPSTRSVPVLTKGPAPAAEDIAQFQIDCLVLKLYYQDEIDSETIIAAENILGEQVLHRSEIGGKLTPEEWVRNAAGTVSGDVEYGRLISTNLYERWKKGRLDAMVNLLASKGFVQILGKPTAHVLEGQEARVTVDRSYLQITLSMYEGENIHLSTKTDISREFPGRRKGQRGPVTRMTSQSVAVVDPETRLILGGRTYTRNHPPTELLFVLTASAVKDEPPVESPPQFKIHGQLLGARGGPISDAGVVVYLQGDTVAPVAESITSKSMGQFKLGPIPALTEEDYGRRRYLVLAEALGHGPAWRQVHRDAQGIIPMKLRAHESAHVSGVVVTTDSKPVAGAKVWVRAIIPPEATEDPKSRTNDLYLRAPLERWSATTKSDGSFRITDVADRARIQLSVSHPDFAGSIVHVKPGKDSVIEVQAAATVIGRVLYGKTGRPAAGVKVQAQGVDHVSVPGGFMNSWAETLTDDQGRYKLESLPGGRYNIWAQAQDLTVVALDSFKVEAGQTREAPDLLLVEGGFITGRVINETTGEPFKPGFASDIAIYGPSRPKSGAAVQISRIREDGTFRIRVAPGRNYIYLRPGENWRREQAAVTPPSRWVEVAEGQTVEVDFKIRKYSQDELDQRRKRRHIFRYSIPKTVDEVEDSHDQTGEKTPTSVEKQYETVQLRYADVEDVAGRVEEALRPMPEMELGEDVLLQPLERARQMIIFGPPDKRGIVRKLIAEIDVPPAKFETRVFKPRIIGLQNSDPVQMARLLTALFAEESGQANIYHVICGDNHEQKQQAERLAGGRVTFESVPGTKKIIVISNVPEAYDIVGDLILELDEQKMATEDVKQVREWITHSRRSKKSAEILMRIGRAMLIYANDHDGKYPDTLDGLKEHLRPDELAWAGLCIDYLGAGKTTADGPDVMTAYDAELKTERKGTNVLFNDCHVEFADPDTLKRWNISSNTPVLLKVRTLTATDDFLEDIGLDPNSVRTSELWSEHLISDSPGDPNSQPYRLILDDLTVDLLLRAVRAAPEGKGVRVVAAPQVVTLDSKPATMKVVRAEYAFLSSSDPNALSAKTESKPKTIDVGTSIRITPDVLPGHENVSVDFEWELRQVRGFKEYTGPDKKRHMLPSIAVDAIESTAVVPDGGTLLICGTRFTEYRQSAWSVPLLRDLPGVGGAFRGQTRVKGEPRTLLIMVKAVIDPESLPSLPPPARDPDDPLPGRLWEKFDLSARSK
ncbi:MAG: M56 family metallopeptidase [Planctomycetota bacterium]